MSAPRLPARRLLPAVALAALLVLPAPGRAQPDEDPLEAALSALDIAPADVSIDILQLDLMAGQRPRSPVCNWLMRYPTQAGEFADVIADLLANGAQQQPVDVLSTLSRWNGRTVRRGLIGDPVAKYRQRAAADDGLLDSLRQVGARRVMPDELASVPPSVQQAAAIILFATHDAAEWIDRAHNAGGDSRWWTRVERELVQPTHDGRQQREPDQDYELELRQATERYECQFDMIAAQDLLFAVIAAREILLADPNLADADFLLEVPTRLGWVVLADSDDHAHEYRGELLLTIDVGGNDQYSDAGASGGLRRPIGISLDLAGDDRYITTDERFGSFGAGVLGVGLLWDEAGDDTYQGSRRSQACGLFGVGVLIDRAGNDTYRSITDSQAHATAGYAALIDVAGDDRYEAYNASQAFAGVNAAAALIDLAGNDVYDANDTDIRFPAPQNPQHNVSMCQGAASGVRADYLDGVSTNGGVAVLLDAAGHDTYTCGVFGQGVGYWFGTGMLLDRGGEDRYTGHWYVQGASAHFAVGVLIDSGGDDEYFARQNMALGAGHDIGVGVCIDAGGNDRYTSPTLGLGASNAAGIGLFFDYSGDDTYQMPRDSCAGWANPNGGYRALRPCWGVFADLGGTDTYAGRDDRPAREGPADGQQWTMPPDRTGDGATGVGVDLR